MAWTWTRLEVPVITGDPSILLAMPPPTGVDSTAWPTGYRPGTTKKGQENPFHCGGKNGGERTPQ